MTTARTSRLARNPSTPRSLGFTLMELMIAMAIFSILGLAVVYLMRQGMTVFAVGTQDSAVQDRADTALPKVRKDLLDLFTGDRFDPPPPPPSAEDLMESRKDAPAPPAVDVRMRAGFVKLRDMPEGPLKDVEVPYFAFVAATAEEWRDPLLRREAPAGSSPKDYTPAEVGAAAGRDGAVFRPPGGLMEVVWLAVPGDSPEGALQADPDAILTLRRGFRAPVGGEGSLLDPASFDTLAEIRQRTTIRERGVLHFSAVWRNAFAPTFDSDSGGTGDTDAYVGPVWDSTRALERTFRFFRGPESLFDPSDDRFPSAVRLEVTLATISATGYKLDAQLLESVLPDTVRIKLSDLNPIFAARGRAGSDERWLKIGTEWMRVRMTPGNPNLETRETTVERHQRGTRAVAHPVGSAVYLGVPYYQEMRLRMSRDAYARKGGVSGR